VGNKVGAVHVTAGGAIWFGTTAGVARFDGTNVVNFTKEDGLADSDVLAICGTPDGLVWFGTRNGLSCYDDHTFKSYTTADGLPGNWISCSSPAPDGTVWLGCSEEEQGKGWLTHFDETNDLNFSAEQSLANNGAYVIKRGQDGALFLWMAGGLTRFDGTNFTWLTPPGTWPGGVGVGLDQARDGSFWM